MPLRTLPEKDFFGRKEELKDLYNKALEAENGITQSAFLSGARGIGKTELLKQLFNHLFWGQAKVAPFYYCVNNGILSVPDFSRDYLTHYILQRFAFEKKDFSIIGIEGLSLERLSSIAEERKSTWALELLDRYRQSCQEPIDSMRIALSAPYKSALATGVPVVVMIDEFQRLKNLHIYGAVDPMRVALFEEPVSYRVTPHLITGSQAEIQEILFSSSALSGSSAKIDVPPLKLEDATLMFSSLLDRYGRIKSNVPDDVFEYLGGNPFYIKCMAKAIRFKKSREIGEKDFWTTYLEEIHSGNIYLYWASILKSFFPEVSLRRKAIEILNKINSAGESLTSDRISRSFSLRDEQTEAIMKALYLSGFVTGEFGVFRIPRDRVLRDFIDCLYMREILEKSYSDFETKFLEKSASIKNKGISFEMTIPMVREAELVAAQAFEQIGKNLHLDQDVIGQLQMAIIEACINAIEHSKGEDRKVHLSFDFSGESIEISIESSGREFVSPEVGEPFTSRLLKEETGRGWGIDLIKSFTDSVKFEKTERGTKVILVKSLRPRDSIHGKKDTDQ